jgi:hypothetical protein
MKTISKTFVSLVVIQMVLLSALEKTLAQQTIDDQSQLQVLREAAKSGNASAGYSLAIRILEGKARSPEILRALGDSQAELNNMVAYAQSHPVTEDSQFNLQYISAKERFQKLQAAQQVFWL